MALLFLAKGRRPIVMAKVKYGENDDWNQHRRDAAHLTEYTEEAWNLGLTWQVMDPEKATVEDLLQAPVLYISGSQAASGGPSQPLVPSDWQPSAQAMNTVTTARQRPIEMNGLRLVRVTTNGKPRKSSVVSRNG